METALVMLGVDIYSFFYCLTSSQNSPVHPKFSTSEDNLSSGNNFLEADNKKRLFFHEYGIHSGLVGISVCLNLRRNRMPKVGNL